MFRIIIILLSLAILSQAQSEKINSGPMPGYSTMREVVVWLQTVTEAEVALSYWVKGTNDKFISETYRTKKNEAYTAKLVADECEPGNIYAYEIIVDGEVIEPEFRQEFKTQTFWQWRTDPPEFTFATGSCAYINEPAYDRPGEPYGGDYQIFESIYKKAPDFMLWLGDNVYLREADWNSRSGIIKRYTHDRAIPELKPLYGSMNHYAIWDDHDYGPDNSDRGFWNKNTTMEIFELMWGNPSFGFNGNKCAATYFKWADCDFFLMDNRTFRTPDEREKTKRDFLGEEQIEWLMDGLVYSRAPFKFIAIGSQVLNPLNNKESYISFNEEREKIFNMIHEEKIEGVIFISGDVHRSELSKLEREGAYPFYDITISPLTAGVSSKEWGGNPLIVKGTQIYKHNFATITITGEREQRKLTCIDYDSDGDEQWRYEIKAADLEYPNVD